MTELEQLRAENTALKAALAKAKYSLNRISNSEVSSEENKQAHLVMWASMQREAFHCLGEIDALEKTEQLNKGE